ncbi:MAG: IS66 family transposase, partial [Acinetobacter towneri]
MAAYWTAAGSHYALNQTSAFCHSPNALFHSSHDLRHTAVMNTLPDLSQLTHEQLLEFTRQLAMQHQSLAQSNQELEKSNQQLDAKV